MGLGVGSRKESRIPKTVKKQAIKSVITRYVRLWSVIEPMYSKYFIRRQLRNDGDFHQYSGPERGQFTTVNHPRSSVYLKLLYRVPEF